MNVLMADLFRPGRDDPQGMHGVILRRLQPRDSPYEPPADEPLTFAAYAAGWPVQIYLEHAAVGAAAPEMPLFLQPGRYVNLPLEPTYDAAYGKLPAYWRGVLERG